MKGEKEGIPGKNHQTGKRSPSVANVASLGSSGDKAAAKGKKKVGPHGKGLAYLFTRKKKKKTF